MLQVVQYPLPAVQAATTTDNRRTIDQQAPLKPELAKLV